MPRLVLTLLGQCPRVRRPNSEVDEGFIAQSFKGAHTSGMFWGVVGYGYHSPLVPIRKRTSAERTHDKDRLGLNSKKYCEEVLKPYLLPLLRQISSPESLEVIEGRALSHTSKFSRLYRLQHSIHRLPWPASSPDLNLIENIWAMLKNSLRKQWRNPSNHPHNETELIIAAQTTWGALPWGHIYHWFDKMPVRVLTAIRRGGRSNYVTKLTSFSIMTIIRGNSRGRLMYDGLYQLTLVVSSERKADMYQGGGGG